MQTELTAGGDGVYAGTVASNVAKLNINAAATHPNARVQITSGGNTYPENLNEAGNSISRTVDAPAANKSGVITVKATAEDGSAYKDYAITIFREKDADAAPVYNASGGIVSKKTIDGEEYEIHTFIVEDEAKTPLGGQFSSELTFTTTPADGVVEVLVVAGGGGGGANGDTARGGGGGAGGFIYHPAYNIGSNKTFAVKVGAGGAKADAQISNGKPNFANNTRGGAGGNSEFGNDFTAYGGGGGGNLRISNEGAGGNGGSGGGGAYKAAGVVTAGKAPQGALKLGNKGGSAINQGYSAAGGGGAAGQGVDISVWTVGSSGGAGTQSAISGALSWYAGGGAGGAEDKYNVGEQYGAGQGNSGSPGTGDGGSGSGGANKGGDYIIEGGNGGSGIVIVRWKFVSE
jgi:hypothetical protein